MHQVSGPGQTGNWEMGLLSGPAIGRHSQSGDWQALEFSENMQQTLQKSGGESGRRGGAGAGE